MTAYHGAVARYLGLLALLLGRVDDAIARHEIALDMHARFRARPWVARSRYDLAGALVARGAPGDRQRAVGLLNEALDVANEIGMARLIEQALELKLQLQGIDASSSPQLSIDAVAAAVSVERPDLRDHAADDGQVTLVFTDIEGYSELTERLGDRRTQDVLRAHGEIVSRAVAAHSGTIVKTQGDGCMMVFPQPAAALACTMAIRDAIDAHAFGADVGPLRVRMGVHAGEAIREGDDFFGRTVIVASRVACAASGGDILVTDAVRSAAEDGFGFDAGRELTLKGLRGSHRVFMLTGPR